MLAEGEVVRLTIVPPGLTAEHMLRAVVIGAGIVGVLLVVVKLSPGDPFSFGGYFAVICASALLAVAAYLTLRDLLDVVDVRISSEGVEVTHSFPVRYRGAIARGDLEAVVIGPHRLVQKGYFCQQWPQGHTEVVLCGRRKFLHFGRGLGLAEQTWIKDLIEARVPPEEKSATQERREEEGEFIQPPERFWAVLGRYSALCAVGAVVLVIILLVLRADQFSLGAAGMLVLLCGTVALLSYRNFRLERVASAWHRAVVKFLAGALGHRFSAMDSARVGHTLPDFPFFHGPRQTYNVAWSDVNPDELIAFDFTAPRAWTCRDGVGCALRVKDLSREVISIRPRLLGGEILRIGGMRFPDNPTFARRYCITAENEGRARALLSDELIEAILSWQGPGPPPWVCLAGGYVGLRISRKYAVNDRTMRYFYEYAERLRQLVSRRLRQLRGETDSRFGALPATR